MTCNIPPPRTLRAHSEVRETVLTAQGLRVPDAYCLHTICLFPVILRGDCECWYAIATKSLSLQFPSAIAVRVQITWRSRLSLEWYCCCRAKVGFSHA